MMVSLTTWQDFEKRIAPGLRIFLERWPMSRRLYAQLHTHWLRQSFQKRLRRVPLRLRSDPTYLAFYLALEDARIRSRLHAPLWYQFQTKEIEALLQTDFSLPAKIARETAQLFCSEEDTESLSDFFTKISHSGQRSCGTFE